MMPVSGSNTQQAGASYQIEALRKVETFLVWAFFVDSSIILIAGALTVVTSRNYFAEEGFMSYAAAISLALCSIVAAGTGFLYSLKTDGKAVHVGDALRGEDVPASSDVPEHSNAPLPVRAWYAAAMFLLYLSFDEMLQLHESGGLMGSIFYAVTGLDLGISIAEEITLGLYLLLALSIGYSLRSVFPEDKKSKLLLMFAGLFFGISLIVDIFIWPIVTIAVEDGSKQLGYFFLFAALIRHLARVDFSSR